VPEREPRSAPGTCASPETASHVRYLPEPL
jgi:hypothetical protein